MWQLTWMLGLLPDWFWALVLIAGVLAILASFVLKFIPFVSTYRLPLQVGGILALLVGVYFQGVIANEAKWEARVKELEAKLVIAEQESKQTNTVIQEKIVKQKEFVKGKTEYITKYIDKLETKEIIKEVQGPERVRIEQVIKYIETCPVPKEIIELHNAATEMNKAAEGAKK
jgi:hypothetical protein